MDGDALRLTARIERTRRVCLGMLSKSQAIRRARLKGEAAEQPRVRDSN